MSIELVEALDDGDVEKIQKLILNGEDIYRITENDKWTYLHISLTDLMNKTPVKSIEFLLEQGLDVNAVDNYGNTPLIYAVRQRNVDGIRLLLENGADKLLEHENKKAIDALRTGFDRMPLDYDTFEILLSNGANPDKKNSNGTTARELLNVIAGVEQNIYELFENY